MKLATTIRTSLATAILCVWAGAAMAQAVAEPVGNFAGWYVHDHVMNTTTLQSSAPQAVPVVVYDNTSSAAAFAVSSTDLASTWGDELLTTNTGTLSATIFSLFNSGSSAGPLLTAQIRVDFFDANTAAPLGAFTTNINFGTGLPQGFFSLITVTGLDPLLIDLNTSDVIVTQKVLSKTGTANRLGVVSFNPVVVGSSDPDMYIASTTIGSPGWYTFGNGPANPGWQVSVVTAPVPTEKSSWGKVKNLYR